MYEIRVVRVKLWLLPWIQDAFHLLTLLRQVGVLASGRLKTAEVYLSQFWGRKSDGKGGALVPLEALGKPPSFPFSLLLAAPEILGFPSFAEAWLQPLAPSSHGPLPVSVSRLPSFS